jgi:hypothetical protein
MKSSRIYKLHLAKWPYQEFKTSIYHQNQTMIMHTVYMEVLNQQQLSAAVADGREWSNITPQLMYYPFCVGQINLWSIFILHWMAQKHETRMLLTALYIILCFVVNLQDIQWTILRNCHQTWLMVCQLQKRSHPFEDENKKRQNTTWIFQ